MRIDRRSLRERIGAYLLLMALLLIGLWMIAAASQILR